MILYEIPETDDVMMRAAPESIHSILSCYLSVPSSVRDCVSAAPSTVSVFVGIIVRHHSVLNTYVLTVTVSRLFSVGSISKMGSMQPRITDFKAQYLFSRGNGGTRQHATVKQHCDKHRFSIRYMQLFSQHISEINRRTWVLSHGEDAFFSFHEH